MLLLTTPSVLHGGSRTFLTTFSLPVTNVVRFRAYWNQSFLFSHYSKVNHQLNAFSSLQGKRNVFAFFRHAWNACQLQKRKHKEMTLFLLPTAITTAKLLLVHFGIILVSINSKEDGSYRKKGSNKLNKEKKTASKRVRSTLRDLNSRAFPLLKIRRRQTQKGFHCIDHKFVLNLLVTWE